jgi:HD-GYP domain-containing protein (c-di-GMP phosphodiesterase class II)
MDRQRMDRQRMDRTPVDRLVRRPGLGWWLAGVAALTAGTGAALAAGGSTHGSPWTLFIVVTIAAGLCAIAAAAVIVSAFRRGLAEAALLGAGLWGASVLPLVHGLAAPGVLISDNSAVVLGAFFALPAALASAFPVLMPGLAVSRRLASHWRAWVVTSVAATTLLAVTLMAAPNAIPAPITGSMFTVAVSVASGVAMLVFSWRQLTLFWVSERPATFVTATAFAFLGITSLVWIVSTPFTAGWWLVHALDIAGVLAGCVGVFQSHRVGRSVIEVLAPVVSRDPLVALEFGLAPVVHEFVADLDRKDPITRDHVIRTAESAVRVGEHVGLSPRRLRYLGLAALLHDVGKLEIPDAILQKPGRLDPEEYEVIKRHPATGMRMLAEVPMLAPAAPIVAAHHERIDGAGYPNGLAGTALPLEARIISICDAFDAMANTRQYRDGMGNDAANAVLREHAGSQWDEELVATAIPVLSTMWPGPAQLDGVGRNDEHVRVCADALPEEALV